MSEKKTTEATAEEPQQKVAAVETPVVEEKPAETPKAEGKTTEAHKAEKPAKKATPADSSKKLPVADLLAAIEQMTIIELNDLVKAMEEKFGISAAAPVAVAAVATAAGGTAAPVAEEKEAFTVVLKSAGSNKINIIKLIRKYDQTLGLKEAKDLAEAAPKPLAEGVKKDQAEAMKKEFEEAGATIELQ
jgi:large subunit ribosomal protein L7/L12